MLNFYFKEKIAKIVGDPSLYRFITIGVLTAIIYLSFFSLGLHGLHLDYRIAVSVAYVIAVTFHFLSNRQFTFKAHNNKVKPQLTKYLSVLFINYLVTLLVMQVTIDLFGMNPYLGLILSIGITTALSFLLLKNWVFSSKLTNTRN